MSITNRDEIKQYLAEISKYEPLTREEESTASPARLVLHNLKIVVTIAKKYQNRGLSLAELIASGNEGLIIASTRFDPSKGFKFVTYARHWIIERILAAIGESRTVWIPRNQREEQENFFCSSLNVRDYEEADERIDYVTSGESVFDKYEEHHLAEEVRSRLSVLSQEDRSLVEHRYGIGTEEKSVEEIAKLLRLDKEYIRERLLAAMRKMKYNAKKVGR